MNMLDFLTAFKILLPQNAPLGKLITNGQRQNYFPVDSASSVYSVHKYLSMPYKTVGNVFPTASAEGQSILFQKEDLVDLNTIIQKASAK